MIIALTNGCELPGKTIGQPREGLGAGLVTPLTKRWQGTAPLNAGHQKAQALLGLASQVGLGGTALFT